MVMCHSFFRLFAGSFQTSAGMPSTAYSAQRHITFGACAITLTCAACAGTGAVGVRAKRVAGAGTVPGHNDSRRSWAGAGSTVCYWVGGVCGWKRSQDHPTLKMHCLFQGGLRDAVNEEKEKGKGAPSMRAVLDGVRVIVQ